MSYVLPEESHRRYKRDYKQEQVYKMGKVNYRKTLRLNVQEYDKRRIVASIHSSRRTVTAIL